MEQPIGRHVCPRRCRTSTCCAAVSFEGRPMRRPRFCARLRPSAVRVWIRSRSTSANPPNTAIINRPVLVPVSAHGSARERNCALVSTIRLTMANRSKALRAKRSKASWMICQPHVGPYVAHCSRLLHPHPRLGFVVPQAGLRADNVADRTFHVDAGRRIAARNGVLRRQDSNLQPSCPYRRTGMSTAGALSN
jgi:hypothetical protein